LRLLVKKLSTQSTCAPLAYQAIAEVGAEEACFAGDQDPFLKMHCRFLRRALSKTFDESDGETLRTALRAVEATWCHDAPLEADVRRARRPQGNPYKPL